MVSMEAIILNPISIRIGSSKKKPWMFFKMGVFFEKTSMIDSKILESIDLVQFSKQRK